MKEAPQSLGVRMALGETQIVAETRDFLTENGVILDSFSQVCFLAVVNMSIPLILLWSSDSYFMHVNWLKGPVNTLYERHGLGWSR